MNTPLDFLLAQLERRVDVPTEQGKLRLDDPWGFRYSYIGYVSGTFDIPTGYDTADAHLIRVTDRTAAPDYAGVFTNPTRTTVGDVELVVIDRVILISDGSIDGDYVVGKAMKDGFTWTATMGTFVPGVLYAVQRLLVMIDQSGLDGFGDPLVDGSNRLDPTVRRFYTYIDGISSDAERLHFFELEIICFNATDAAYGQGNAIAWADGAFDTEDPLNETGAFIMRRGLKICKLVERPIGGATLAFGSNEFTGDHYYGTYVIPLGTDEPITIKAYIDLGTPTYQGDATIVDEDEWKFDFDPNIQGRRLVRMLDVHGTILYELQAGTIPYTLVAEQPRLIRSYRIDDDDPLLVIAPHLQDSCWPYDHAVATCALIPILGDTEQLRDIIRAILYNFFEVAKTTLTGSTSIGDTVIHVASAHGLQAGDRLLLDYSTVSEEVCDIGSVAGLDVTVSALTSAHTNGAIVYGIWDTAHTNLSSGASLGANTIDVNNVTGFADTDTVIIGRGTTKEVWRIDSIAGTTLTLNGNLVNNHSSGEQVVSGERTPAVQGFDFNIPFSFRSHYDFTHNWVFRQGGGASWVGYALTRYMITYPASPLYSDCLTVVSRLMDHLLAEQQRTVGIQAGSIRGGYGSYTDLEVEGVKQTIFDFFVEQNIVSWAATEHNVDFYFLCSLFYRVTGNTAYRDAGLLVAHHLAEVHWDATRHVLRQSLFDPVNGVDPDTTLDSISWGGMALHAMGRDDLALAGDGMTPFFRIDEVGVIAKGYRPYGLGYSGVPDPVHLVWGEGSFGLALYYYKLKDYANACRVIFELEPLRQESGAFLYVTDRDTVLELPPYDSVSSSAWEIIASEYPEAVWTKEEGVKIVGPDLWTGLPTQRFPVEHYCTYGFPDYQPDEPTTGKLIVTVDIEEQTGVGIWTYRATLERLISANFSFVTNGRMAESSLEVQRLFNDDAFLALGTSTFKRLVFRINGVAVHVGFIRQPVRTWSDLQVRSVSAIGPVDALNTVIVKKKYQPPGGSADLSWYYYQLFKDFILPRGFAQQPIIETIGISKEAITFDGTLREAVTDLGTLAEGYVYWGFQIENNGTLTFFVRQRDEEAPATYEPVIGAMVYNKMTDAYEPAITMIEHTDEDIDLVTKLFIKGGATRFPNMLKNPSFEEISSGGNTATNLLKNGDFDGSNAGAWHGHGSIKNEPEDPSLSPPNHLELDRLTEEMTQGISTILPMRTYALDFWIACENPTTPNHVLGVVFRWYENIGGTLIRTDSENFETLDGHQWKNFTMKRQSPALAGYVEVEFQPVSFPALPNNPTGEGDNHGIMVDSVVFYPVDELYQVGWRIETTATPKGQDANANPTGLYWVDWQFEYINAQDPPGVQYGAYGIVINTYGLTGGKYVRLIQSSDGEFDVTEKTFYMLAVTAKATTDLGAPPPAGNNFKVGVVWYKDDPASTHVVYGPTVHLSENWTIVGGQVFLPTDAKRCRVFFEPLDSLLYFIDGAQFNQSPSLPTDFTEESNFFDVISTQDVYGSTDPRYYAFNPPDHPSHPGYGSIEEKVENPSVINHADALIYAKSIFDVRALTQASESLRIIQVDSPLVLYGPDGFMQASGIDGFTFPKLWVARASYEWNQAGLLADIELQKEVPRLEQVLERERANSIISVGKGTDSAATYVPPEYDTFIITAADPRVTTDGSGNTVFTDLLDFAPLPLSIEGAYRQLEISPNQIALSDDGTGVIRQMALTLPPGQTLEEDDQIVVWYRVAGGQEYASKTVYITATGGGAQTIIVGPTPLLGSVRAWVRGQRLPPSDFDVLLDASTGDPNIVSIHAGALVETGDEIVIKFDPDYKVVIPSFVFVLPVPGTTPYPLPFKPHQWPDTNWSFDLVIGDQMQYNPTITLVSGVYYVAVPTDRAGDRMFYRIHPDFAH